MDKLTAYYESPQLDRALARGRPEFFALGLGEFLQMDLPERQRILEPWLFESSRNMVFSQRGVGKTYFALNCAYAVASGGEFLSYKAPKPRSVLYVDGEMPSQLMQERLAEIQSYAINSGMDADHVDAVEQNFQLITPDLQPPGQKRLNLTNPEHQETLEPFIEKADLVVLDNISTLMRGGQENEAASWEPVQDWALSTMQGNCRTILWVHHAGKGGAQRGTSKREDDLDTVVQLKRPPDYRPEHGASFEVHFTKGRSTFGEDSKPIEARLTENEQGLLTWSYTHLEESTYNRVVDLANEGLKNFEIADELQVDKSTVSRHARKGVEQGDIRTR